MKDVCYADVIDLNTLSFFPVGITKGSVSRFRQGAEYILNLLFSALSRDFGLLSDVRHISCVRQAYRSGSAISEDRRTGLSPTHTTDHYV